MLEIFKTTIAQMGAVGVLLVFASIVIYRLSIIVKEKDEKIYSEADKRETLLKEALHAHHASIAAIQAISERQLAAIEKLEEILDRIEDKVDVKRNNRKQIE